MTKISTTFCLFILFAALWAVSPMTSANAAAGYTGTTQSQGMGGYSGPGPAIVSVAQAIEMRDDTRVTLRGNIIQHLGDDKYLFRDATGTVKIEIDHDKWNGLTIGPDDLVEVQGEVDKDWNSVEIEVKRLMKQ